MSTALAKGESDKPRFVGAIMHGIAMPCLRAERETFHFLTVLPRLSATPAIGR